MVRWSSLAFLFLVLLLPGRSYAGQIPNPFTNRLDLCSTITEEDGSPIMAQCQTIEVTNGTLTDDGDGNFSLSTGGGGSGDSITVNSSAVTDPDFFDGDIDWTLTGGNSITATVACTGCVDATDLSANSVADSEITDSPTITGTITTDGVTLGADENLTLGSDTLSYVTGTGDVELSDDLTLIDINPHLQLQDSNGDDFEFWADGNQVYISNVTDGIQLARWNSAYDFFLRGSGVDYQWPKADGSNGQFLTTNGSGAMTWTTSSGSGDITDVWSCTTGDCNQPVIASAEFLDGGTATADGTSEGILLPRGTTTTAATSEGQVSWDSDDEELRVGDGTIALRIGQFIVSGMELTDAANTFDTPLFIGDNNERDTSTVPIAITCRNLYATVDDAPGAGNSWVVTIQDDGVNSGTLTCTISDTGITCNDTTNATASIAAGSLVRALFTESGTATTTTSADVSLVCYPDGN